jgi:hypothetical protein
MKQSKYNKLVNDLIAIYLDGLKMTTPQFLDILKRHQVSADSKIFHRAAEDCDKWLTTGDERISAANKDRITAKFFKDKGCVLGVDYSMHPDGVLLSDDAMKKLDIPQEIIDMMNNTGAIKNVKSDPIEDLEEVLGVPFAARLKSAFVARKLSFNELNFKRYVAHIYIHLSEANPAFQPFVKSIIVEFGQNFHRSFFEWFKSCTSINDDDVQEAVLLDLINAVGGEIIEKEIDGNIELFCGTDALGKLDLVMRGSNLRPALLGDDIRKMQKNL